MKNRVHLYDTKSLTLKPVEPLHQGRCTLYTCGPTVYNYAHIGNFRTYVALDLLRRTLTYFGLNPLHVMNLTDIDDKTIDGAMREKVSLAAFTARYKKAFAEDLHALHILPAHHNPEATAYLPQMIAMIEKLLDRGFAYKGADGSVYFSIRKFPDYGKLSHLNLSELLDNASSANAKDEYDKEQAADFVLWKHYDKERDGENFWESPFGPGRPGWHIECSAMARELLGQTVDIHAGGVDLIFPHHENEIAQSECSSGCAHTFAAHWMHVEHLLVDNRKMSKSLGNFYLLRDLLAKGYSGREVRYALLQVHYRKQLNFTFEGLLAARNALMRLDNFCERLRAIENEMPSSSLQILLRDADESFSAALADDLNISVAISTLFDLVRAVNQLCDEERLGKGEADLVLQWLTKIDSVLGVLVKESEEAAPEEALALLKKRQQARATKAWKEADSYRDELQLLGYKIEDLPNGEAKLKKVSKG